MTLTIEEVVSGEAARTVFHRVVVGVDGSPQSREAARQAAVFAGSHGTVALVAAWMPPPAVIASPVGHAPVDLDEDAERRAAENALARVRFDLPGPAPVTAKMARGIAWDVLIREAVAIDASLIAVGSHGHSRIRGLVAGSTATEILHNAPCSVLVARSASSRFPTRIVVGVDGSAQSAAAYRVAQELAERFDAELRPVLGADGKGVDRLAVVALLGHRFETSPGAQVDALVAAAGEADLLVVGSRGLHGVKALGSVSERVAHRARCSTLVVRPTPTTRGAAAARAAALASVSPSR